MSFQRSYSKVWWASDNQLSAMSNGGSNFTTGGYCSAYFSQQHQPHQLQHQFGGSHTNSGYHSLDYNNYKTYTGNLSRIQEVDDEQNISKISWEKHDSPGSLRSQDSGFSDNDESHSTRSLSGRSLKASTNSPSAKSDVSGKSTDSPTFARTIATPPTVIRRVGKSEFYTPLVSLSRRISFSGSPASAKQQSDYEEASIEGGTNLMAQLDEMQLVNDASPKKKLDFNACDVALNDNAEASGMVAKGRYKQRRRRIVSRRVTKPLTPTKRRSLGVSKTDNDTDDYDINSDDNENNSEDGNSDETLHTIDEPNASHLQNPTVPAYNNETVYLGEAPPPYNNETVVLGNISNEDSNNNSCKFGDNTLSPPHTNRKYAVSTSTPKAVTRHSQCKPQYGSTIPHFNPVYEYENPLLNGHPPALQDWLGDIRMSYEHEVMSTLQTKSIVQEAFKNLTITTNTVTKLIRQLQQNAICMQSDFERIERILTGSQSASLHEALTSAEQLVSNVSEFTKVLERRTVFFTDSRTDRKKYEDNIEQIRIIIKDTRYSLERQHYINLESLLDDIQVLKRYLLMTIRPIFERMVRVIVQSVEHGRCDLMLRANINMIATLTNIDYEGFASLTDAFIQSEAVRTLLIVCLENKLSSVRALALRALATICCAPAAIAQLGSCGGIEIIRDILQVHNVGDIKRGDVERREAVSLLTQITAVWHGPQHRVEGLKDCIESIVEGLTHLIVRTNCAQALLLSAAALNNLSRMEVTSHYSIMSNEAIFKLINVVETMQDGVSIFLYEQIVAMLHNMSLNKKCHSHLANGSIINFITSAYQKEFYKSYDSRAESDAQRRAIKSILHMLTHLVHGSSLGNELLEQQRIPSFFKMAANIDQYKAYAQQSPLNGSYSHGRDISLLAQEMLLAQQQERAGGRDEALPGSMNEQNLSTASLPTAATSGLKLNLTRQESFV